VVMVPLPYERALDRRPVVHCERLMLIGWLVPTPSPALHWKLSSACGQVIDATASARGGAHSAPPATTVAAMSRDARRASVGRVRSLLRAWSNSPIRGW